MKQFKFLLLSFLLISLQGCAQKKTQNAIDLMKISSADFGFSKPVYSANSVHYQVTEAEELKPIFLEYFHFDNDGNILLSSTESFSKDKSYISEKRYVYKEKLLDSIISINNKNKVGFQKFEYKNDVLNKIIGKSEDGKSLMEFSYPDENTIVQKNKTEQGITFTITFHFTFHFENNHLKKAEARNDADPSEVIQFYKNKEVIAEYYKNKQTVWFYENILGEVHFDNVKNPEKLIADYFALLKTKPKNTDAHLAFFRDAKDDIRVLGKTTNSFGDYHRKFTKDFVNGDARFEFRHIIYADKTESGSTKIDETFVKNIPKQYFNR